MFILSSVKLRDMALVSLHSYRSKQIRCRRSVDHVGHLESHVGA